ncbi:unnamed protein product [Clonostachys rosea]|uniref:Uncharacterized protein n=1 Tax=Bionectria ochroleuca TaxID=29856 RepID=A0ABY6U964_BIOOC|nr:unnamed protein product [Clonostachys rosea]
MRFSIVLFATFLGSAIAGSFSDLQRRDLERQEFGELLERALDQDTGFLTVRERNAVKKIKAAVIKPLRAIKVLKGPKGEDGKRLQKPTKVKGEARKHFDIGA